MRYESEIICEGLAFPEGPAFATDGSLWLVELKGGNLCRFKHGILERTSVGGEPNGIAVDATGQIVFCDAGQCAIRRHDPVSGKTVTLADSIDGKPLFKPNDLALSPDGEVEEVIEVPGANPTNCAFDPSGLLGLVVTEAEQGRLLGLKLETCGAGLWKGGCR